MTRNSSVPQMSRSKDPSGLLALLDSDWDSDNHTGASVTPAAKKPTTSRVRNATSKTTKPNKVIKPTTTIGKGATSRNANTARRRSSDRIAAGENVACEKASHQQAEKTKRKPTGKKQHKAPPPPEEKEDLMEDASAVTVTPTGPSEKKSCGSTATATRRGLSAKISTIAVPQDAEVPDSTRRPPPRIAGTGRGRKGTMPTTRKKNQPVVVVEVASVVQHEETEVTEIPETQQPLPGAIEFDVEDQLDGHDDSMDVDDEREDSLAMPPRPRTQPRRGGAFSSAAITSRRPLPSSANKDASVALRRRLGDIGKKYEALESRYRDLREVAVREAESNFDRLKKQSDDKAGVANALIASLKTEVAFQKEAAREAQRLEKQLDESEEKTEALRTQVTELTTALSEAKTENKSLLVKLAASRNAEAAATAKLKVPGSAVKHNNSRSAIAAMNSNAEAAIQLGQMKEDLYADLTGLIVRGCKRGGAEDVFDCLQTGRNGTLHFKLAIVNDLSEMYDEAEFRYMPQLDPSRDRALIEVMPDFLVEEITFPRPQAAKFFARVMKSLTERLE